MSSHGPVKSCSQGPWGVGSGLHRRRTLPASCPSPSCRGWPCPPNPGLLGQDALPSDPTLPHTVGPHHLWPLRACPKHPSPALTVPLKASAGTQAAVLPGRQVQSGPVGRPAGPTQEPAPGNPGVGARRSETGVRTSRGPGGGCPAQHGTIPWALCCTMPGSGGQRRRDTQPSPSQARSHAAVGRAGRAGSASTIVECCACPSESRVQCPCQPSCSLTVPGDLWALLHAMTSVFSLSCVIKGWTQFPSRLVF